MAVPRELRAPVASQGYRISAALLGAAFLAFLPGWVWTGVLLACLAAANLAFFRNPRRAIPAGEHRIVSPADGRVVGIEKLDDPDGILGEHYSESGFHAEGKRAWMTIPILPASETAPEAVIKEADEPEAETDGAIRFLRITEGAAEPTDVIEIDQPVYLEVSLETPLETPPDEPVVATLRWSLMAEHKVKLYPVEGDPNRFRSSRVLFRNPEVEVDLALPPSPVDFTDGALPGRWRI